MIIIYNLSGLLVGVAGIAAMLAVMAVTDRPAVAMLIGSMVLIGLGCWWRSRSSGGRAGHRDPVQNAWPALFFIPVPFIGIVTGLLSVPAVIAEFRGEAPSDDPRYGKFKADEDQLHGTDLNGDAELSRLVRQEIAKVDSASNVSVFTRIEGDRVLILAELSKLKNVKAEARQSLLDGVLEVVRKYPAAKGKSPFVGIKGRTLYGIVHVPPNTTKISESAPKELLYDFYVPAAASNASGTKPSASAATKPATAQPVRTGAVLPGGASASPSRPAAP